MRIDNQKVIIATVGITLVLLPIVAFTVGPSWIILGLLFAIFFPGYALLSALFPKQHDLGGIERLALGIGLSIAVVALIALILNYTPFGVHLYPILLSVSLFITATSAIAYHRQRKLPEADRLYFAFSVGLSGGQG